MSGGGGPAAPEEIEVKLPCADLDAVRRTLSECGATRTADRWKQMQAAREALAALEIVKQQSRKLYAANNPIGENCVRDVEFARLSEATHALRARTHAERARVHAEQI